MGNMSFAYEVVDGSATNLVKTHINHNGTMTYNYDDGKIKKIEGGLVYVEYDYDDYGRLKKAGARKYTYDDDGNITSHTDLYGNIIFGAYRYENGKLMRFNSPVDNFVYNEIGNPTIYRGEAMEWDFKNLRAYKNASFTYDASGLRKAKINKNQTTTYYWAGEKLIAERRTLDGLYIPDGGFYIPQGGFHLNEENFVHMDYVYGITEMLGFTLERSNGAVEKYWYTKNIQGDVTHIYKETGNTKTLVASYSYDAWGNHTIGTNVDGIIWTISMAQPEFWVSLCNAIMDLLKNIGIPRTSKEM